VTTQRFAGAHNMDDSLSFQEQPSAEEKYLIAGWEQWADAGDVSSGLSQYLIDQTEARKIGEIESAGFYLFQIPGAHHLIRPEIKLVDGRKQHITSRRNEFFYSGDDRIGLIIFLGSEPQLNEERYAESFLDAVEELGVQRVATIGGVYGTMPYNKDREILCLYSLPAMKEELAGYAVEFSNYEGGSTIGTYLAHRAESRGIELVDLYAVVPAYEFSQALTQQGTRIERDFKAWYDLMRRLNFMFGLGIDLSELKRRSDNLISSMTSELNELDKNMPQLQVKEYLEELASEFTEKPFMPLGDVWERELKNLFDDGDV
jgi:proteasome assembly chaperone (PAC2) family protein